MRTAMQAEYRSILVQLHHAQVEALDDIKHLSGKSRVALIREAVAQLIGRYTLAEKERDNAKVA